jgi:hypothetical protein
MKQGGTSISRLSGRKPRKLVEITGLETLEHKDEKPSAAGTSGTLKRFHRKKKAWMDDASISSTVQPTTVCLSDLPVVCDSMTDDELRRELIIRNPAVADALSGTRQWLLDQLGVGTISIVKSQEVVSDEFLNRFGRVNSSMNVEQLRREFVHRHPSKKKIARGKWKAWFLLQLHEGSICVFDEVLQVQEDDTCQTRPDSPQGSMANTVSTAPTIFSSSTRNTFQSSAIQECSLVDDGKNPKEQNKSKDIFLSKKNYFSSSQAAAKPRPDAAASKQTQEEPSAPTANCEPTIRSGTRQARLQTGNRHKYFNASQVARKNASAEELSALKASVVAPKHALAKEENDPGTTNDKPEEYTNKSSEFASKKWLNDAKKARKLARRSICVQGK